MTDRLKGLVAVVNGAGRGLGRAVAMGLAREGACLVVNDLGTSATGEGSDDPGRAQLVVDAIVAGGGKAIPDTGDITNFSAAENMIQTAIDTFGKLDILVNCAGIIRLGSAFDTTPEDFDDVIRVHLRGYFNTTYFAARHWIERKEYGRLINFASGASIFSQPTLLAYSTAKTGVIGLTRACANALVAYNVTANCVRPGAATAMTDLAHPSDSGRVPPSEAAVGGPSDPAHVVPLIVYLASPVGSHVSGRLIEGRGNRYALWSEPTEEKIVQRNFLEEPDQVYAELDDVLFADLRLADLKAPMAPLSQIGDWKANYGFAAPPWDFITPP
jgi:NAD(P)-dependent dehydrogenase (short-subunit alcohol dehydrogenase family)